MSNSEQNIIETALAAGRDSVLEMIYENGTPYIVAPDNFKVHEFPHLRDNPIRIEETTVHTTAQSFIDYYNQYANDASAIFIDEINSKFLAILDYHDKPVMAGWKKHKSFFYLSETPEWKTWNDNNKKAMSQEEFGRFIENALPEILDPTGADMLEIALSIQAKTEVKFSKATRLDNGQTQLAYNEVIDGKAGINGQLKIPEKFTIGLKLFRGGQPYKLDARLRYRIKEGNLQLWYELIRAHDVIDANINDITDLVIASISVGKIYRGVSS